MYVQDDMTLGNPGVFGFVKKAISTVYKVATGQQTVKLPTIPQAQINVQLPEGAVPKFNLSNPLVLAAIGIAAAVVVLPMLTGRRRS